MSVAAELQRMTMAYEETVRQITAAEAQLAKLRRERAQLALLISRMRARERTP